ncbi:MAG: c-type cytochrome [Ignavibacterium sp.]|nr:c-type cytochrome [Ignavibacterium sp.]
MKILLGAVITILTLLVIFLLFIYSGWYNVSANEQENGIMKWVLNTTKDRSIESRSKDITVPDLNDLSMLKEGFEHYNEMCVSCHGAPGLEETEVSVGLNPKAPYLVKVAKEIDPKELFWITKNGIKMTGMPAWGKTHSDEKIWAIVAFVKKLPNITAEEYQKMESSSGTMEAYEKRPDENEPQTHSHSVEELHH